MASSSYLLSFVIYFHTYLKNKGTSLILIIICSFSALPKAPAFPRRRTSTSTGGVTGDRWKYLVIEPLSMEIPVGIVSETVCPRNGK